MQSQINAVSTEPTSQIGNQIGLVEGRVVELHNVIDALETRLRLVMLPCASGGNKGEAIPKEALSPIAEYIRDVDDQVDRAANRLLSIINGLAL